MANLKALKHLRRMVKNIPKENIDLGGLLPTGITTILPNPFYALAVGSLQTPS
jgi:hypothetical protein